jgi:hypothetical protein
MFLSAQVSHHFYRHVRQSGSLIFERIGQDIYSGSPAEPKSSLVTLDATGRKAE